MTFDSCTGSFVFATSLTLMWLRRKEQVLPSGSGETKVEVPVTLLWVLVYLSQHFDRKGEHVRALEYIDEVGFILVLFCMFLCV